ncbi:hypothetical protein ACFPK5_28880 [Streptomyces beijiangensis]|uniref:hypothetical protein n=1 Tax=Streptomyces beijiangensis TaxID=163361 RepID=UPI0031D0E099
MTDNFDFINYSQLVNGTQLDRNESTALREEFELLAVAIALTPSTAISFDVACGGEYLAVIDLSNGQLACVSSEGLGWEVSSTQGRVSVPERTGTQEPGLDELVELLEVLGELAAA